MNPTSTSRRNFLQRSAWACTAGTWGSLALPGQAQTAAMAEHLRILCSGPGGSIPDIVARRAAEQLTGHLAAHVVVDNRPGAAGQLSVAALKSAPADGNTLLLAQGAIATVYPYLYPKLGYDPVADLQPVSLAGEMTLGLAVGPAVPAEVSNVRQLLDWMRRNPKAANVGSPGTGTLPHLLEAMLFRAADTPWQHITYSGGPPAMTDLLGGQIAALVLPEGLLRQHKLSGRLRVLATSGAQRTAYLPDVPSLVEQGFADLVVREWFAFFMPARVPAVSIEAASAALRLALARPELVAAFADSGMVAVSSTPTAMAQRIASEQRFWAQLLRSTGIRIEA